MKFVENLLRRAESGGAKCILCGKRRSELTIAIDGAGVCGECYDKIMKTRAQDYYAVSGLERLFAPFEYNGDLRRAILDMKFNGAAAYAAVLSRLVLDALPPYYLYSDYDLLVPVPLHSKRYADRGFNQAELLAEGMSEELGIELADNVLFRTRETQHQMSLTNMMRELNVRGAFYADRKSVEGKRVMLVDDIYTAGATLRACSQELREKGAEAVSAIVAAENFVKGQEKELNIKIPVIHKKQ